MADVVTTTAMGRIREFADDAAGDIAAAQLRMFLLQATEADDTVRDYDVMGGGSGLLDAAGNTEATFTNYANKVIQDGDITVTEDEVNNRVDIDVPDQTFTSAGNGVNNTLTDVVIAFDPDGTDTDSQTIPVSIHDFTPTTDGSDLTVQIATAGLLRAA